jgi:sugar lactone lactonase YvrE
MTKSRLLLAFVTLLALFGAYAPTPASSAPLADGDKSKVHVLPGDAVFPEGIAFQPSTDDFFVSSTTDGTIFRGDIHKKNAKVFLPGGADGRTTAIGLKVDHDRLFVAGGGTGQMFIYNTENRKLIAKFSNGVQPTFINDVAIGSNGTAYFTDSLSPFLYRISRDHNTFTFERWLDFTGTPLVFQPGFNVNGIAATSNGKYLIVVQSNTGKLFRITISSKQVVEIDLGGATVTNGDGIVLRGHTLYVVRNQNELVVKIKLSDDVASGRVISSTTDATYAFPTTAALAGDRLLVVNSQFDKRGPGLMPELPFTVSNVRAP